MVGVCGMSQLEAAYVSVGEFIQRKEAYDKAQQIEWERCRWVAWSIIRPFAGKNGPSTPMQWARFPWEQNRSTAMISITEDDNLTLDGIFNDFLTRKNKHS